MPRDEPPDGLAGGRVVKVDRVEFQIIPDTATAAAALQAGEIDFLERPSFDLLPLLRRNSDIRLRVLTELASQAILRPNALHPPFSDPRAREALNFIINQDDEMGGWIRRSKILSALQLLLRLWIAEWHRCGYCRVRPKPFTRPQFVERSGLQRRAVENVGNA